MKTCLVLCPNKNDATSFWRGHGPFSHLAKNLSEEWKFTYTEKLEWIDIAYADVVFLQRPYTAEHRQIFDVVKSINKKIWIDYDDYLFEVPRHNPAYKYYKAPAIQNHIAYMLRNADIVSVSTKDLAKKFSDRLPRAKGYETIANAWPTHLLPWDERKFFPHKRILWRGSSTHDKDLQEHFPSIKAIVETYPEWEWVFIGDPGYDVENLIPKDKLHMVPTLDLITYYNSLKVMECSITIVPLLRNEFNDCKSNIAWQEATYAGTVCLTPDYGDWKLNVNEAQYFDYKEFGLFETFKNVVESGETAQKAILEASFKTVRDKRTIDVINLKRKEILSCI